MKSYQFVYPALKLQNTRDCQIGFVDPCSTHFNPTKFSATRQNPESQNQSKLLPHRFWVWFYSNQRHIKRTIEHKTMNPYQKRKWGGQKMANTPSEIPETLKTREIKQRKIASMTASGLQLFKNLTLPYQHLMHQLKSKSKPTKQTGFRVNKTR